MSWEPLSLSVGRLLVATASVRDSICLAVSKNCGSFLWVSFRQEPFFGVYIVFP